ncbi:MAG: serine hydrolase domain-containing protein [Ruminococcus sp.]|nr:serine hydrolase domain-containing protein [Ruminococcus sp.]
MKRIFSIVMTVILTALMFSACGESGNGNKQASVTETAAATDTDLKAEADKIFEESFQSHDFKGTGYLVYKDEEIYSGGTGKANKKEKIDNSADAVYHVASVTKQFTAAAILKLCEEKKMSLDDTLSKYFPDYKSGADITIHNLLSMQSGIPDFTRKYDENGNEIQGDEIQNDFKISIDGVAEDNSAQENRDAIGTWIFSQKLLFEQGGRFSYSNSNYFLLGEIIEQVSKKTYFDYLKTSFFEPLEMTTAGFDENYDVSGATVAKGYNNIGLVGEIYGYPGVSFGSGDMMASPKDMYKWSVALHSKKVLGAEMLKKMTEKYVDCGDGTSYGYGLMISESPYGMVYMHRGSTPHFFSYVIYLPQKELFLSIMSNYASETTFSVTNDVSEKILKITN